MPVKSKELCLAVPAKEESLSVRVDRIAEGYIGRHVAHLTPRYVVNKSREILYNRHHPGEPWLTADAIAILSTMLRAAPMTASNTGQAAARYGLRNGRAL